MSFTDETGRQYADVMAEIKRRSRVIDALMSGKISVIYMPTTIETIGLQFRNFFELIAFGSLAANKKIYSEVYKNFANDWKASKLIARLTRLNPAFYPKPVKVIRNPKPGIVSHFETMTEGFLTPDDLIEAHGRCGALMHATNPYGKPLDLDDYKKRFADWHINIVNLLNFHNIHLLGEEGFWHIQMGNFSTDQVTYNYFARTSADLPSK